MDTPTPPEGSGVLERIHTAEEWRVLGEKIRRSAPELYEQLFAMFVEVACRSSDEERENIPESYFVT
jgi:hypothetical protein